MNTPAHLRARADILRDPAVVVSVIGVPLSLPTTRSTIGFHKSPDPVFPVGSVITVHGSTALALKLAGRIRIHGYDGEDFGATPAVSAAPHHSIL